jgi:hypothetical protein
LIILITRTGILGEEYKLWSSLCSLWYRRLIICTKASKAIWRYRTEPQLAITSSSWERQIVRVVVIWLVPDVQTSAVGIDPSQRLLCST